MVSPPMMVPLMFMPPAVDVVPFVMSAVTGTILSVNQPGILFALHHMMTTFLMVVVDLAALFRVVVFKMTGALSQMLTPVTFHLVFLAVRVLAGLRDFHLFRPFPSFASAFASIRFSVALEILPLRSISDARALALRAWDLSSTG
jgi:hypothetical protein